MGAFVGVAIVVSVLVPRDFYTGTNSVRTRSFPAELGPGQVLCTAEQRIPAGTGRIELEVNTGPRPPLSMELRIRGEPPIRAARPLQGPTVGRAKIDFAIPKRPASRDFTPGVVCVRSGGDHVFFGGVAGLDPGDQPASAVGKPLAARIAVWFRPPVGEKRSVASLAGQILLRAELFRPGFVGRWTYALILVLLMPALLYAGVRLMAVAAAGLHPRRLGPAGAVAVLAFLNAAAWSLITPSFNAPDEGEHFAYGQYLGETGHAPSGVTRPAYSSDELRGSSRSGWSRRVRRATASRRGCPTPSGCGDRAGRKRSLGRRASTTGAEAQPRRRATRRSTTRCWRRRIGWPAAGRCSLSSGR